MDTDQASEVAADIAASFTTLDEDLTRHDTVQDEVQKRRQRAIELLGAAAESVDYTSVPDGQSDALAKYSAMTTYLSALKDQEASVNRRATLKLKKRDADQRNDEAQVVAEFLRRPIAERVGNVSAQDQKAMILDLETEIDASDNPISETEMREDPTDIG